MKLRNRRISIPSTVLLCLLMVLTSLPLYTMAVGAFKENIALVTVPTDLRPYGSMTIKNVLYVLKESRILLWLKNSLTISIAVAFITGAVGMAAGYGFSRIRFHGRTVFFALVLATMMMPKQVLLIPNFLVAQKLHLVDSQWGLILTTIAPAFSVFLSRQYILGLQQELFEAAEIDGCSEWGKFWRVCVPLSLPAFGTSAIFAFFSAFNDYVWQSIMISKRDLTTLPVGIATFAQLQLNNRAVQMAGAFIASIPLIVIFLLGQKMFIKGATVGAIKG